MSSLSLNFKNYKSVFTLHLFMYFFVLTGLDHCWHKFAEKEKEIQNRDLIKTNIVEFVFLINRN